VVQAGLRRAERNRYSLHFEKRGTELWIKYVAVDRP
jgi:hypothetical protein